MNNPKENLGRWNALCHATLGTLLCLAMQACSTAPAAKSATIITLDSVQRAELQTSMKKEGIAIVSEGCVEGERLIQADYLYLRDESFSVAAVNAARIDLALRQHGYAARRIDIPVLCGYHAGLVADFAESLHGKTKDDVTLPVFLFNGRPSIRTAYQDLFTSFLNTPERWEQLLTKQVPLLSESSKKLLRQHLGVRYIIFARGEGKSETAFVTVGRALTGFMLGAGAGIGGTISGAVGSGPVSNRSPSADMPIGRSESFRTVKELSNAALPFKDFPDTAKISFVDLDANRYLGANWRIENTCTRPGDLACPPPSSDGRSLWHKMSLLH